MASYWDQNVYLAAIRFAARAHGGQTVPGSDLPYLLHLACVAMEVMAALREDPRFDGNLAVRCALLHDVLEDTRVSYGELEAAFGQATAQGVQALTKNPCLPASERLADSLRRILEQPQEVWLVKMADRITNLQPPPACWTAEKIRRYRDEAREILAALHPASILLADRLAAKIRDYAPGIP